MGTYVHMRVSSNITVTENLFSRFIEFVCHLASVSFLFNHWARVSIWQLS